MSRSVLWTFTSSFGNRLLGICAVILLARTLGKEAFGAYGILISTVGSFGMLASVTLSVTATRFVAMYRDEQKTKAGQVISLCLFGAMVLGSLVSLSIYVCGNFLAARLFNAANLVSSVRIASLLVLIGCMAGVVNGILSGLERFSTLAGINLLGGILQIPMVVGGAYYFGVNGALLGMILCQFVSLAVGTILFRRAISAFRIALIGNHLFDDWRTLLDFSVPHVFGSLVNAPISWIGNTLLVRQPGGLSEMAIFTAAFRWREAIALLPSAVSPVASVIMAERIGARDKDAAIKLVFMSALTLALVCIPSALVLGFGSPFIMRQYGGAFVADGVPVLWIAVADGTMRAIGTPFSNYVTASGKVWRACFIGVIAAAVFLLIASIATKSGAIGLTIAYITSGLVSNMAFYVLTKADDRKDGGTKAR